MITHNVKYAKREMKIVYNNDPEILEFLWNMKDRVVIRELQQFLDDAKGLSGLYLYGSEPDHMQILFIVGDPFGMNEGDNRLTMYAVNDMYDLCHYFKEQLSRTSKDAGVIYDALEDITEYLFEKWNTKLHNDDYARFGRAT